MAEHDTRAIQEWLGHRNIQHTTRYTELTTHRFKDFWQRETDSRQFADLLPGGRERASSTCRTGKISSFEHKLA